VAKLTLAFKGRTLNEYLFEGGDILIGRDPECAIHIDSLAVEPRHARVHIDGDGATLYDESGNAAVLVDGRPVNAHVLKEGQAFQVGKHTLIYSNEPAPAAEALAPAEPFIAPQAAPPAAGAPVAEAVAEPAIEPPVEPSPAAEQPTIGWLQMLSGKNLGRTIPLKRGATRIGIPGQQTALIAHRVEGYFISALEGDEAPEVDGQSIGDQARQLHNGAMIRIGAVKMQFYLE